jgi:hypothetical protein
MRRALVALALIAGCSSPRTEVVVTVHASGIRIPDDVDALRLKIADRNPGAGDDQLYDQPVPLCTDATAGSPDCYSLPITVTLYPGSMRPTDSVRVQLDAQRNGTPVIADAALFTFSTGHSLRLDVILYANCLGNVGCAQRDQACGPDDQCTTLGTTPLGEEPDLSIYDLASNDLANLTADLTAPYHDFTVPPDQTIPDLTGVDLLNCVPQCTNKMCGFDGCSSTCGTCGSHTFCDVSQQCATCGTQGIQCCPPGTGKTHHLPLPQALPGGCDPGLVCDGNTLCNPPPDLSIPPDMTVTCGHQGEPCCQPGGACFGGLTCMGTCQPQPPIDMTVCGNPGEPCCFGSMCFAGPCNAMVVPPMCTPPPMDMFFPPG